MNPVPYPEDTRAKGWRFELDHERIRQSDTWVLATLELRPWLLMLWMVAWEQTPCGSLPDDDELISARIGMPLEQFITHKRVLLRKWEKAEDGRLYHPVLVQRALEMIEKRHKDTVRRGKSRAGTRQSHAGVPRDAIVTGGDFDGDTGSVPRDADVTDDGSGADSTVTDDTRTRTSTRRKEEKKISGAPDEPAGFSEAFEAYPPRAGGNSRRDAAAAFAARLRAGVAAEELIAGVQRYRAYCDATERTGTEFVKQAKTFFGPGDHWREPYTLPPPGRGSGGGAPSGSRRMTDDEAIAAAERSLFGGADA
jgi:hypothetical protein